MDNMLLLGSEYILIFTIIGLTTGIYLSCFMFFERKEIRKYIKDEIEKQLKES